MRLRRLASFALAALAVALAPAAAFAQATWRHYLFGTVLGRLAG